MANTQNSSIKPAENQPRQRRKNPLLTAALRYAELGLPVFPCAGKEPLTRNGFKDASTDPDTIRGWWKTHPGANIGIPTGKPSGWAVLDVDIGGIDKETGKPKRGDLTLAALEAQHGELPPTPTSDTGAGGVHSVFKRPDGYRVKSGSDVFGRWLDCRADGGYIIVPPSVHPDTRKPYRWRGKPDFAALAELPDWLAASVVEDAPKPTSNGTRHVPGDVDLDLLQAALDAIPADDRDTWLKVGMALHSIGERELWDSWSRQSDKYDERDQGTVWKSFNGSGVTVASIFELAQRHGWQHPRKNSPPPARVAEPKKGGDWLTTDPDPLRREPPPPDPYPLEALGEILGPAAKRLQDVIQAPDAICGQSLLAAAGLSVQGHADWTLDGRQKPVSIFLLTVGASGERKTAIDDEALRSHYAYQKRLREDQEDREADYQARLTAWRQVNKEIQNGTNVVDFSTAKKAKKDLTAAERASAIATALADLGSEPEPELLPLMFAEEPTYEGIFKLLADIRRI